MKLKRILIYIILILSFTFFEINKVYGDSDSKMLCYYANNDNSFRAIVTFYMGTGYGSGMSHYGLKGSVRVINYNGKSINQTGQIRNLNETWVPGGSVLGIPLLGMFYKYNYTAYQMTENDIANGKCPRYIATGKYQMNSIATNDETTAKLLDGDLNQGAQYGTSVSSERFFGIQLCGNGKKCEIGKDVLLVCGGNELFGDPNYAGGKDENGEDNPPSLAYLIVQILGIMRVVAISALIVLGTIDMGKAVLAGKEDGMKKAQSTFVKRIIACLCVFLVPVFVRIIMSLANMAWKDEGYTSCTLEQITVRNSSNINNQ